MKDPDQMIEEKEENVSERFLAARKSTWISISVNTGLTLLQVLVGFIGHSQALMADGLHSLSDLISDFLVLFANRHGNRSADANHPYGHARIETATTLVLGIMMAIMGFLLLYAAGSKLQHPGQIMKVHAITLVVAISTIVAKEGLFRYMMAVAKRVHSQMLAANAWHSRSDAASSLVVSIGIAGNLAGYGFLDLIAAVVVGFLIVRMGWLLGYEALMELIDTGLSEEAVEEIKSTLESSPGVRGLHELRTRKMGNQALVDAHLLVDPRISVSEGHHIAENARSRLLSRSDVLDVLVHIDPEDDLYGGASTGLPGRKEISDILREKLDIPDPERLVLHYLDGKIEAEIFFSGGFSGSERLLRVRIDALLEEDRKFRSIKLHRIGS